MYWILKIFKCFDLISTIVTKRQAMSSGTSPISTGTDFNSNSYFIKAVCVQILYILCHDLELIYFGSGAGFFFKSVRVQFLSSLSSGPDKTFINQSGPWVLQILSINNRCGIDQASPRQGPDFASTQPVTLKHYFFLTSGLILGKTKLTCNYRAYKKTVVNNLFYSIIFKCSLFRYVNA